MSRYLELRTDDLDDVWTVNVKDISAYSQSGNVILRNGITLKVEVDEIEDLHAYLHNKKNIIHPSEYKRPVSDENDES